MAVLLQAALSIPERCVHRPAAQPGPQSPPRPPGLGLGLMGVRVDRFDQPEPVLRRPRAWSGHLLAFEIISVHLVVVLVGAAYLARARRRISRVPASAV